MPPRLRVVALGRLVGRQRDVVGARALGQVGQHQPVVRPEDVRRDVADRLRRDRQVARQHPVDEPRVVEQRRVHRQPVGALLDPLERAELVGFGQRLGAGQLVVADELGGQPFELLDEGGLDARDRDARAGPSPSRP